MRLKASELEPGMSVFDYGRQDKNRLVHSVELTEEGKAMVRFGAPANEPEKDEDGYSEQAVSADKEYEIIADAQGRRI